MRRTGSRCNNNNNNNTPHHIAGAAAVLTYIPLDHTTTTYSSTALQAAPVLRRIEVGGVDLAAREASLSLKHPGTWTVESQEKSGRWSLDYAVHNKIRPSGKPSGGEQVIYIIKFAHLPHQPSADGLFQWVTPFLTDPQHPGLPL